MPINAHPEFLKAETEYNLAETSEQKLNCLKKMLSTMPTHKGAENLRAQLRQRFKKLKQTIEKQKKSGKSKQQGIKKSEMQALVVGFPNTGKSSIFKILTNQETKISLQPFATCEPKLGTIKFEDIKIQLIDTPPFPTADKSLINSADTILLIINNPEQIEKAEQYFKNTQAKIIIIFNKADLLNEQQKRKISETLKSKYKKFNFLLFSSLKPTQTELQELKNKLFKTFPIIRIYTKEPRKQPTQTPLILKKDSSVSDVAEKILKGMSQKIKKAKIWGPSSKFPGQTTGLTHILKDKDVVELQTK